MPDDAPPHTTVKPLAAVLATLAWSLLGAASVPVGMMSVMLFDAPGSTEDLRIWAVAGSLWSFPVLCAVSVVGSWVTWFLTRRGSSHAGRGRTVRILVAGLPIVSLLAFALSFAVMFATET